jgi:methylenetetrahydrofolate reductase (NADPH)
VASVRPAISAELTLRRESTADDVRRQAATLARCVDGIQVSDNPYAWVQMSAVSASALLLADGHDPVPILTCRDRNRRALNNDVLGLQALGVDSLMLMRGHRVPENHSVKASTVFDLTGRELIGMVRDSGNFFIGTGARVFRPNRGWQADSLRDRVEQGAGFIQTQICFNLPMLGGYLKRLAAAGLADRLAVMVTLAPLPSLKTAEWIKRTLGDSRIPATVLERLSNARNEEAEGLAICVETLEALAGMPGVAGIHFMTTGDAGSIAGIVEAAGLAD